MHLKCKILLCSILCPCGKLYKGQIVNNKNKNGIKILYSIFMI